MDKAWDKTAEHYHFQCNGCEDNCCKSLFIHHTYIEKAYILKGFQTLDNQMKSQVMENAHIYCDKTFSQENEIKSIKIMCPLNIEGLCILYDYRPMICRLHGLPHELCKPGFQSVKSPGCDAGKMAFNSKPYFPFDRTPFYQKMAAIEMDFRQTFQKTGKTKKTVAQMLVSF